MKRKKQIQMNKKLNKYRGTNTKGRKRKKKGKKTE